MRVCVIATSVYSGATEAAASAYRGYARTHVPNTRTQTHLMTIFRLIIGF